MISDFVEFDKDYVYSLEKYANAKKKMQKFEQAYRYVDEISSKLISDINLLENEMNLIDTALNGNKSKKDVMEKDNPTISNRISIAMRGFSGNSYGPTKTQINSFEIAKKQWNRIKPRIINFIESVENKIQFLESKGSPKIID